KFSQTNHRNDQFFKAKLRLLKILGQLANHRTIRRRLDPPRVVAEILLHHALLALSAFRQHGAQLRRRRELRIGNAGDVPGSVDIEIHLLRRTAPLALIGHPAGWELEPELIALRAYRIESLQTESD